jgi:hypothetical protein
LGFEESALARLRRYREEADRSIAQLREAQAMSRRFAERLFAGLEYTAVFGRQAGFEIETSYAGGMLDLRTAAGPKRTSCTRSSGRGQRGARLPSSDLPHECRP